VLCVRFGTCLPTRYVYNFDKTGTRRNQILRYGKRCLVVTAINDKYASSDEETGDNRSPLQKEASARREIERNDRSGAAECSEFCIYYIV